MMNSQSLLGQAVVLEPARNADNVLQPLVDATTPLIIRAHSSTQTGALLRFEDSLGNLLSSVDANGAMTGAAASPSGGVTLSPATVDRNLIRPTADTNHALVVKSFSASQSAPLIEVRDSTGAVAATMRGDQTANFTDAVLQVSPTHPNMFGIVLQGQVGGVADLWEVYDGNSNLLSAIQQTGDGLLCYYEAADPGDVPFAVYGNTGGQTADLLATHRSRLHQNVFTVDANGDLRFSRTNSINLQSVTARIKSSFLDNTAATYQGRGELYADDFNASRLAFRWEADGTAARIGFLGGAAVVKQVGASAAGIAAITDANAKAAITALQAALAAYNLVTSPA